MRRLIMSTNAMDYPTMKRMVTAGLEAGFRAFDTARDYHNEHVVGRVLQECLKEQGISREEIYITTKIGNSQQAKGNIAEQMDESLRNLRTDYVDCWLMHWPYPGHYLDTYGKMQDAYRSGKAKAIGLANCQVRHLEALFGAGFEIAPQSVQFERHPLRVAADLMDVCRSHGIDVQAYSPLCRMIGPVRNSPVLRAISERCGKSVGQVILRWHLQSGSSPCFRSLKPERLAENIDVFDFELTADEIAAVDAMDQDYKYHLESASCPGY